MQARKIIFFINPISGTGNKAGLLAQIENCMQDNAIAFEITTTDKEGDYTWLPEKIKLESITDVVVCGGDGTVNQLAFALLGINVNIGIIPMGSGNGLALAAGIKKDVGKALEVIVQYQTRPVDGFYINNRFSCMLCGLGFDAQVAHDFSKQPKRGLSTYVQQTIKNFFIAKPYPFIITAGEKKITCAAYFISIANSNQFGNNVTIAPRASLSDGLLDVVVVKKMNKFNLLYKLLRQVTTGEPISLDAPANQQNGILYFQTSKLLIENPGLAPLHIDGDPAKTATFFEISIVPQAFRLLQPQ